MGNGIDLKILHFDADCNQTGNDGARQHMADPPVISTDKNRTPFQRSPVGGGKFHCKLGGEFDIRQTAHTMRAKKIARGARAPDNGRSRSRARPNQ